ncbi:Rv1733c family protein [Streptomyces sp. SGAir0957]
MDREIPPAHPPEELPRVVLWRWRHNPLRRPTDLAQAWIAVGLFLAVLAATPAAMSLVGDTVHRRLTEAARQQTATGHATSAELLHDAPRHPEPGSDEAKEARYPVTVRFIDPRGAVRTARTDVEPASSAGSTVRVWVDAEGRITDAPLTTQQIRDRAMGRVVITAIAVPLFALGVYAYVDRRIERYHLARWGASWARVAPGWTAPR